MLFKQSETMFQQSQDWAQKMTETLFSNMFQPPGLPELQKQFTQNLFGNVPEMMFGYQHDTFYQQWMEQWQKLFLQEESNDSEMVSQIMQKIMQHGNLYMDFGNTVQQLSQTMSKQKDASQMHELSEKLMEHFTAIYQENVGQFLNLPLLGLNREHTQKMVHMVDARDRFMEAFGQLMMHLGIPLQQAMESLTQTLQKKVAAGEDFSQASDVYDLAVAILEQHYVAFFKTPVFAKGLNEVIEKALVYRQKSNELIEDVLQPYPIAVQSELDEVYQSIHHLKRKNREQDAVIQQQQQQMNVMQAQMNAMQAQLDALQAKIEGSQHSKRGKSTKKLNQAI